LSQKLERKAKKKASASAPSSDPEESAEAVSDAAETEKADENAEVPFPAKEKGQKVANIRHKIRSKGPDSVPKGFLKRKKTTNYWLWAAPAAVLVLLFSVLGYYYLL
jgi:hypothetical protein